jgi:hypothetical protein
MPEHTTESIRNMLKEISNDANPLLVKQLNSLLEAARTDWIKDFKLTVRKHQRRQPDTFFSECHFETYDYSRFIRLAQTPISKPEWNGINYLQKVVKQLDGDFRYSRLKFDVTKLHNEELFGRAAFEARTLLDLCPRSSTEYVGGEAEARFMEWLCGQSKESYKMYVNYKIYQTVYHFSRIRLVKMMSEFQEDMFGNVYLTNVIIYELESDHPDIYEAYNVEKKRILSQRSGVDIESEIQRVEEALRTSKPISLKKEESDKRQQQIELVKDGMLGKFRELVLGTIGRERLQLEEKLTDVMETSNDIFKKVYPQTGAKLSDVLYLDDHRYQREYYWHRRQGLKDRTALYYRDPRVEEGGDRAVSMVHSRKGKAQQPELSLGDKKNTLDDRLMKTIFSKMFAKEIESTDVGSTSYSRDVRWVQTPNHLMSRDKLIQTLRSTMHTTKAPPSSKRLFPCVRKQAPKKGIKINIVDAMQRPRDQACREPSEDRGSLSAERSKRDQSVEGKTHLDQAKNVFKISNFH